MHPHELEDRLRKYRPAGPPAALRERCLAPLAPARVWPWAAAAALLLAAALAFHAETVRTLAVAGVEPAPDAAARERTALAEALGGGPDAERAAALIVARQELWHGDEQPPSTVREAR